MKKVILASNSPRRREILGKFINFEVVTAEVKEDNDFYKSPETLVMALAFEKANSVAIKHEDAIVIGADTVVEIEGEILGKPKSREDAKRMMEKLRGKTHKVITGFSIIDLSSDKKYMDYEVTEVVFKDLSDEDIEAYLNKAEYMDKAGAYGIQEEAALFVEKIEGDYLNIVGFPISKIYTVLKDNFDLSLLEEE